MKKYAISAAILSLMGFGNANAQDIYTVGALSTSSLDGDARYVGMGGAMSALGANLSAISTNPASAGLYRRSDASITAGCISTPYEGNMKFGQSQTHATFNQAGILYAMPVDADSKLRFCNVGFNYKRSNNLRSYIGLNGIGLKNGMSQTWQLADLSYDLYGDSHYGSPYYNYACPDDRWLAPAIARGAYASGLIEPFFRDANGDEYLFYDEDGKYILEEDHLIDGYYPMEGRAYNYHRGQWGGVNSYDFNLSFNISDRVYVGANLGVYNVDVHSSVLYDEDVVIDDNLYTYTIDQEESLSGYGFDGKFGLIVRPIEENPLRVGLSVTTPTAFDLSSRKYLGVWSPYYDDPTEFYADGNEDSRDDLHTDYRVRTPWKLNLSAATTIGNCAAIDVEYELQNRKSAAVRYSDNGYYDDLGEGYHTDEALAEELSLFTRNVHTLRLGAELLLGEGLSLRAGYNFVSSPFTKDAYLNLFAPDDPSHATHLYATNTDYVNIGATNRFTLGLGYSLKHFYLDAGYVFQTQKADVYAFHYNNEDLTGMKNNLQAQNYYLNRHQFQVTMGFRF